MNLQLVTGAAMIVIGFMYLMRRRARLNRED